MSRIFVRVIRYFHRPSAARIRAELRRDARRMVLGQTFYQGMRGHQ